MNINSINSDITALEKALKIVEKTENYLHFNKTAIMFPLCEEINRLKEKRDNQLQYMANINKAQGEHLLNLINKS